MSFMDFNKAAGAVLLVALTLMVIGIIGNALVHPGAEKAAAVKVAEPAKRAAPKAKPLEPVTPLLATASVERGEKIFKKCAVCHDASKGGKNKVGPHLWGIVGAERGTREGFSYSSGMKEKPGKWTYETLNAFLHKPKDFIPGTKMGFAGLDKAKDRADVILYLRSLSDSPVPLP